MQPKSTPSVGFAELKAFLAKRRESQEQRRETRYQTNDPVEARDPASWISTGDSVHRGYFEIRPVSAVRNHDRLEALKSRSRWRSKSSSSGKFSIAGRRVAGSSLES